MVKPGKAHGADRRRYRKVFTRLWRHPKFRALSSDEKVMTIYALTGPQTNRIGLFVFSIGAAHEDLNLSLAAVNRHLTAACKAFGWCFDRDSRVLWIPSWWTWNDPKDNLKAFQGALTDLNDVPQCGLVERFCRNLVGIPPTLHGLMAPLWESIGDPSGIDRVSTSCDIGARSQEQEQEQEQEKEQEQEQEGPDGRLLLSLWNDTVSTLPKVQAFSKPRLRHARARLRDEPDIAFWVDVFRRMDASDFLTGRKPSRDQPEWRADIDFALRDGIAGKVLEGKYDNRQPATKARDAWECPHVDPCGHKTMCDVKLLNPDTSKYPVREKEPA